MAAPAAAPPILPIAVPIGCEPGSPVIGSRFKSESLILSTMMVSSFKVLLSKPYECLEKIFNMAIIFIVEKRLKVTLT